MVSWTGLSTNQINEMIELDDGIFSGERVRYSKRKFHARQRDRRQKKWKCFERVGDKGMV